MRRVLPPLPADYGSGRIIVATAPTGPFAVECVDVSLEAGEVRAFRSASGPALGNPQFRESASNHLALRGWAHLFVDIKDPTVDANIKRPA